MIAGAGALAVAVLVTAGCTGGGGAEDEGGAHDAAGVPAFEEQDCPAEVQRANLASLHCGYLTVPEDRSHPDGPSARIFVVRTDPPDEEPSGIILGIDADLGSATGLGAGPGAARTHSVIYQIHTRGTGRSEPSLACPEIDQVSVIAAESTSDDPDVATAIDEAVGVCRARLADQGIDPAAYDVAQAAADIEDLRVALGVDHWNLATQGSYSRYVLAAAASAPDRVGYLFLDSPQFPGSGDQELTDVGFAEAVTALGARCAAEPACAAVAPDLPALLAQAEQDLDAAPVTVQSTTSALASVAGRPVDLVVDGTKLRRAVRAGLGGDGPGQLATLPATIASAARGDVSPQLAATLGNDVGLCLGVSPLCPGDGDGPFAVGVYLTALCRDQQGGAADGAPTTGAPFNPFIGACDIWDVDAAPTAEPFSADVPLLAVSGELDSFSPASLDAAALAGLDRAHSLVIPGQTHNVMGFGECQIAIRNAWILDPASPPADTSCVDGLRAAPIGFTAG